MKDGIDRIAVDVLMSPFAPQHFQLLQTYLGPAEARQLAKVPGDVAAIDLALTDQRVFAGLRNVGRPTTVGVASLLPSGRLRDLLVGYIGTTGESLGPLAVLNIGIPAESDADGYAMSRLGGWRRQFGQFTVFSFQRDVLEEATPQLHFDNAKRPAQIRVRIDDISQSRIAPGLNDLGYARTRATSLGNLRFLESLDRNFMCHRRNAKRRPNCCSARG